MSYFGKLYLDEEKGIVVSPDMEKAAGRGCIYCTSTEQSYRIIPLIQEKNNITPKTCRCAGKWLLFVTVLCYYVFTAVFRCRYA